jgi:hypothetical protein
MGNYFSSNTSSQDSKSRSFENIMDYIATYYILTMNFQSLKKLHDKKYCENMVVLTSDIIQKHFNDLEVTYLAQRVKNGVEVNQLTKDDIIFFNKQELDKYDVSTPLAKKRMCSGIAKFYVKIAHIFAAIIMTINPVYVYKDNYGNTIKKNINEKSSIPVNAKDRKVIKKGICSSRLEALMKGQDFENIPQDGIIKIHPNVCNINSLDRSSYQDSKIENFNKSVPTYLNTTLPTQPIQYTPPTPPIQMMQKITPIQPSEYTHKNIIQQGGYEIKSLQEEPGIPELFDLYLDKYDYQTGTFNEMTDETKLQYLKDLKQFYTSFTGETTMPSNILKFSDIKLRNYNKTKDCESGKFKKSVQGSLKDDLFQKYAVNLQKMAQTANIKQESLLEIINNIFTYDLIDDVKKIRINPQLTEDKLKSLVEKTRKIIVDLYVTCENDFVEGVKLYEAIVENQIRVTTESQIQQLDSASKRVYTMQNNMQPKAKIS